MTVTANSIITPQAPKAGTAVATTANSTYTDTPTNTVVLITAGANGARVTKISALARATVTNTELQLFRSPDTGTTKRLFNSRQMVAYTVAQTTGNPPTDFGYSDANPLVLAALEQVYVGIGVSNTGIVFTAEWADY